MEPKILIIVEGAKTDLKLMKHLLNVYGIDKRHQIVSFNTNIYTLYNEMFAGGDPENLDILQVLKEREHNDEKRRILDDIYSDILLVFDLDPQAPDFSPNKICEMMSYFTESSDMGKLYLNYPMVESFYHMKSIPDDEYLERKIAVSLLSKYKSIVNSENRNKDYTKFAVNKEECDIVIRQNLEKGKLLSNEAAAQIPDEVKILEKELSLIDSEESVSVLCTCTYYIAEYDSKLIE